MWKIEASDYDLPWAELKSKGLSEIERGARCMDLGNWDRASSAHLAVLIYWWRAARKQGQSLTFTGLNTVFQQLVEIAGVGFIQTGEADAGH